MITYINTLKIKYFVVVLYVLVKLEIEAGMLIIAAPLIGSRTIGDNSMI